MNAIRLSETGQTGQPERADREQPTPKWTVGRVVPVTAPQSGGVDPGLYTIPAGTWLLWK